MSACGARVLPVMSTVFPIPGSESVLGPGTVTAPGTTLQQGSVYCPGETGAERRLPHSAAHLTCTRDD